MPSAERRARPRLLLAIAALGASLSWPAAPWAHDASAYGGVFRTRSLGETWLNADAGLFLNAALTVAVNPRDPGQLLLGTDTGLLRSRNGGQSWAPDAHDLVVGAVFSIAFAPDGRSAICASPGGAFRFDGERWEPASAPGAAVPARSAAFGATPGRAYLLGQSGLFRSDDGGRSYAPLRSAPGGGREVTALAVTPAGGETLLALAGGTLWASADGGGHWAQRGGVGQLDAIAVDPAAPSRLWAASHGAITVSDDLGTTWREVAPLPERSVAIHGVAAAGSALLVASDRGMFRSADGGRGWTAESGTLPAHLESGPLIRDPSDPRTVYAVYALMPREEVWRAAVDGSTLLSRLGPAQIAGSVAFMLFLVLASTVLVRRLARAPRALQPR